MLLAGMCLAAAGCRHKLQPLPLPIAPSTPVPLEPAPEPKTPPQVASVPLQPPPPVAPVTEPVPKKPKKVRKPVVQAAPAPAPVEVASSGAAPAANVIGALTPGDAAPQSRKQAEDMIAALDKRLAGLAAEFKEKQREPLARVANFEKQAQAALKTGDSEGAVSLATKAKLLLDDLLK